MAARISTRLLRSSPAASLFRSALNAPRRTFTSSPLRCETKRRIVIKRYTEEHEWISVDTDTKIGTIGITEYAQRALGDVVFVELPSEDLEVGAGDSIGAVESVKSASDIMTPVSGTVTEGNVALDGKPGLINKSAEGEDGWIAKIAVDDEGMRTLEELMDKEAYDKFTSE